MILFNAALVAGYWERLLVLPLEQRRVAGREPPSEQRSEGQPGYLGESLLHLHPHRAPISATRPTDIPPTDIRAMHTRAPRDTLPTPVPPMDTRATRHILPIPVLVMEIRWLVIPAIALRRTGRLEPSTVSSLLAEFWPEIHPQSSTPLVAARTNASVKRIARRRNRQHSIAASARGLTALSDHIPASVHSPWRQARAGLILSCNPSNRVCRATSRNKIAGLATRHPKRGRSSYQMGEPTNARQTSFSLHPFGRV